MKIDIDNPNLTAFALGELSGHEREAMEQAVAASPEAQARVNEIQQFARLVRSEFDLDLKRAAEKRLSILSLLQQGDFWSDRRWVSLAAAAMVAIAAVIAAVALAPGHRPQVVADQQSKPSGRDTVVQVEADPTPAELLARTAARVEAPFTADRSAADAGSGENAFASAASAPLSILPIQVGTASYARVRKSISSASRPPKDAVRIEEMINYFSYDYPQPEGDRPFSINLDAAKCPWQPANQLVRIGLKGRDIPNENRGASNLVFLVDVSGSMNSADRLPLLRSAMRLLVDRLTENDRVAIVVYAGASGIALPSTPGHRKEEIVRAIEELKAGDLSGGLEGIGLAYRIATDNFIKGGVNRVVLATDGELNVGVANTRELVQLARRNARAGVSLSMLGVGDDAPGTVAMQRVAEQVSGTYAFLDSIENARRALVQQINGTLVTIAKDVEVQVVFNPARVSSYRLLGYDNQMQRHEASHIDGVDAAEVVAGHTITALYEVVPVGAEAEPASSAPSVSPAMGVPAKAGELVTVKLHHKRPEDGVRMLTEHSLDSDVVEWRHAPPDFRFAAAVAQFGMILRDSPHRGEADLARVLRWAEDAKGRDEYGYRAGFLELVRNSRPLLLSGHSQFDRDDSAFCAPLMRRKQLRARGRETASLGAVKHFVPDVRVFGL